MHHLIGKQLKVTFQTIGEPDANGIQKAKITKIEDLNPQPTENEMPSRITIRTQPDSPTGKTEHLLAEYVRDICTEKVDSRAGVIESMQENMEYMAGILGRLVERCVLAEVGGLKDARVLDSVLFGSDTNHIREIKILPEEEDDIPF